MEMGRNMKGASWFLAVWLLWNCLPRVVGNEDPHAQDHAPAHPEHAEAQPGKPDRSPLDAESHDLPADGDVEAHASGGDEATGEFDEKSADGKPFSLLSKPYSITKELGEKTEITLIDLSTAVPEDPHRNVSHEKQGSHPISESPPAQAVHATAADPAQHPAMHDPIAEEGAVEQTVAMAPHDGNEPVTANPGGETLHGVVATTHNHASENSHATMSDHEPETGLGEIHEPVVPVRDFHHENSEPASLSGGHSVPVDSHASTDESQERHDDGAVDSVHESAMHEMHDADGSGTEHLPFPAAAEQSYAALADQLQHCTYDLIRAEMKEDPEPVALAIVQMSHALQAIIDRSSHVDSPQPSAAVEQAARGMAIHLDRLDFAHHQEDTRKVSVLVGKLTVLVKELEKVMAQAGDEGSGSLTGNHDAAPILSIHPGASAHSAEAAHVASGHP